MGASRPVRCEPIISTVSHAQDIMNMVASPASPVRPVIPSIDVQATMRAAATDPRVSPLTPPQTPTPKSPIHQQFLEELREEKAAAAAAADPSLPPSPELSTTGLTNTSAVRQPAPTEAQLEEATLGPAWTYDKELEPPAAENDMGGWTMGVYTQEQQTRLNVNELGEQVESVDTGRTKGSGALDTLCDDLRRVRAEFYPDLGEDSDESYESVPMEVVPEMCCRMLGLSNGRTEFSPSNSLSWADDGSLCANAASN